MKTTRQFRKTQKRKRSIRRILFESGGTIFVGFLFALILVEMIPE